eukprot:g38591.t1
MLGYSSPTCPNFITMNVPDLFLARNGSHFSLVLPPQGSYIRRYRESFPPPGSEKRGIVAVSHVGGSLATNIPIVTSNCQYKLTARRKAAKVRLWHSTSEQAPSDLVMSVLMSSQSGVLGLLLLSEAAMHAENMPEALIIQSEHEVLVSSPRYSSPAVQTPAKSSNVPPIRPRRKSVSSAGHKTNVVTIESKGTNSGGTKKHRKGSKNKRFRCEVPECGESFATKFSWRRHRKKHTGERPWGCVYCLRYFGEKSTLKKHLNTHPEFLKDKQHAPWFSMAAMNAGNKSHPCANDEKALSALSLAQMSLGKRASDDLSDDEFEHADKLDTQASTPPSRKRARIAAGSRRAPAPEHNCLRSQTRVLRHGCAVSQKNARDVPHCPGSFPAQPHHSRSVILPICSLYHDFEGRCLLFPRTPAKLYSPEDLYYDILFIVAGACTYRCTPVIYT